MRDKHPVPPSPRFSPEKAHHFERDVAHYNRSASETLEDTRAELTEKVRQVSKREVEDFLAQAVRLFLQGGAYLHHEGYGSPGVEVTLTEDTVVLDLTNLSRAVSERRHLASEKDEARDAPEGQVLDRWRVFVKLEGEVVAAFGRGIEGVQVRAGRASFVLFKDFVKGYLSEAGARPEPLPENAPAPEDVGATDLPLEPGTRDVPRRW